MIRFIDWLKRKGAPAQVVALNAVAFIIIKIAVLAGCDSLVQWVALPSQPSQFIVMPWTIATYMIVHFSFIHLVFNMMWLYWFGEFFMTIGNRRQFIILYIYGGVLGGVFYLLSGWFGLTGVGELCGASASTLAIVVAAAWRTPRLEMPLLIIGGVQLRWLAMAAVILGALPLITGGNIGGAMAHLGGIVAGMAFAISIGAGIDITAFRKRRRQILWTVSGHSSTSAGDDNAALDALLDKVRRSGYTSLSSSERKKLLELSNRV